MHIKTVTIIGANGTQGANMSGIFASFGHAKVYMVSRSIEKSREAIRKAVKSVRASSISAKLIPMDYSEIDQCIPKSDLILECVAEDKDIKSEVYSLISPLIRDHAIIASITSGLSIDAMSKYLCDKHQARFMGLHFFNPPYNMPLCEVIPSVNMNPILLEKVENYLRKTLHRVVVRTKNSPAFLANRVGFQFINQNLQLAQDYLDKGGIDYIDSIIGPFTGRNMAPLITSDFVGLDVHKSIVDNIFENCDDYAKNTFIFPTFAVELVEQGKLGRKAGEGLYKTVIDENGTKIRLVYDIKSKEYRPSKRYDLPFASKMISLIRVGNYPEAIAVLLNDNSVEGLICRDSLVQYVVYAISTAIEVTGESITADDVMAEGFNWIPPLALIEAFGGPEVFSSLVKVVTPNKFDEWLTYDLKSSKYDYRKFMKAKR